MVENRHHRWRFVRDIAVVLGHVVARPQAATQRRHQLGMGTQARGLNLLLDLLLLEQQGLCIEHVEVVGQAALESDHGDVIGFLRGLHRFGGEDLLVMAENEILAVIEG